MRSTARQFKLQAASAVRDQQLRSALAKAKGGFVDKRIKAITKLPEFEQLRSEGQAIKDEVLANLDHYLERYEANVRKSGGQLHWARSAEEATNAVVSICCQANAKRVIKGKTMVGEEIAVNEALEARGLSVVETDLGEYIIQLAKEPPSHIIAPAVHKSREQISDLFARHHAQSRHTQKLTKIPDLVNEARRVLREHYLSADVGITGANFLIAETGSSIIVTNEGNGDLTSTLPPIHIVIAGVEKLVPTLSDAMTLVRLLGRSATGQEITSYTTVSTGPKRAADLDGPEQYHVVLVDNGRSGILGSEFRDMLRCIRCGACLNHCPVYGAIGGHAYGWVYPGPMGSVLTPLILGLEEAGDLPNACSLNGRCEQVCPVKIPLPKLIRALRHQQFERKLTTERARFWLRLWLFLAKRPHLYHPLSRLAIRILSTLGRRNGYLSKVPLTGGWTRSRDLPAPQGDTFLAAWHRRHTSHEKVVLER